MPIVRQQIRNQGTAFLGLIPTSTCCPSRAAFLSGNQAHVTDVYDNFYPHGGWRSFNESGYESQTIATALQGAGYRTGLFGKYLNQWQGAPDGFVPPGWDVFRAMSVPGTGAAGAYYDYKLSGTGPDEMFGSSEADYSTDVLSARANDFVESTPVDTPLFLLLTPYAPHAPSTPAPRHIGTWTRQPPYRPPSLYEPDVSDKPGFIRQLSETPRYRLEHRRERQSLTLRAVDEAVGTLLTTMGDRMDNTLFVYMSDNGLLWGEHRVTGKNSPYAAATEVPLFMRWDGHLPIARERALAANVDVTATLLDAAGVPQALGVEGVSLLTDKRRSLLLEGSRFEYRPPYCGWRTSRWLFVEYSDNRGRELYDYRKDPYELTNLARNPGYINRVTKLRDKTIAACSPVPPKFTW